MKSVRKLLKAIAVVQRIMIWYVGVIIKLMAIPARQNVMGLPFIKRENVNNEFFLSQRFSPCRVIVSHGSKGHLYPK